MTLSSFWCLEIHTKVADRPPHSSKTTMLIVVIHIAIFCYVLHHKMHITGRSLALRWLFIFLTAFKCSALTYLHHKKFHIFKWTAFYSETFDEGCLGGSQLCSKALILVICHFKLQSALSCKWFPCRGFPLQIKAKNISVTLPVILQNLNLFHRARVLALHQEFPLSYNTLQF